MSRIFEPEPHALDRGYDSTAVPLLHDIADHPLLTLEAVADAADRMPVELVEHNLGAVPAVLPDGAAPRADLGPGAIARGIATNGCWMVLRWIHVLPEYAALRDELFESIAELAPAPLGEREVYLFLSGPGTTTPTHCDPEENILCQVRGTKTFHLGRHPDASTEERQLEIHSRMGGRNLPYLPLDPQSLDLAAGAALYVPPAAPHWVGNGPEVSISLSLVWHPPALRRAQRVRYTNHLLRERGRSPRPPGSSAAGDRLKAGAAWTAQLARRVAGRVRRVSS